MDVEALSAAVGGRRAIVIDHGGRSVAEALNRAGARVLSCRLDDPRVEELADGLETVPYSDLRPTSTDMALVIDGRSPVALAAIDNDGVRLVLACAASRLVVVGDAAVRRHLEVRPLAARAGRWG